jgi:predicted nucleic-acid-binding Zn-ribbon protein
MNVREVLHKGWTCPKCLQHYGTSLPDFRYMRTFGTGYSMEVECRRCGYLEVMDTADYEREDV